MKRVTKRVLVFLMSIMMFAAFQAVTTPAKDVQAATKKTVKVYVKTKKYILKKAAKDHVTVKNTKRTTRHTKKSSSRKILETIVKQVNVRTTYKAKLKTIRTTTKITTTKTVKNYASSRRASINQLKGKIDGKIIERFKKSGFSVEVNAHSPILRGCDGVFSPSRKKIVLKRNVNRVFIHEIGHFTDRENGYISDSGKFLSIYRREKNKFRGSNNSYARSTNKEYFAEVFKEYYTNRSSLKKHTPKSYAFMAQLIGNM